jgi:hypothetical protein
VRSTILQSNHFAITATVMDDKISNNISFTIIVVDVIIFLYFFFIFSYFAFVCRRFVGYSECSKLSGWRRVNHGSSRCFVWR